MASNTKLLAVLALLQVLSLHVHAVSAMTGKHHPKLGGGGGGGTCCISGFLHGKTHKCNRKNGSGCCVAGRKYPQFRCSPPVSARMPATLTLNSFHPDSELVVALSSGWLRLDGTRRCGKMVRVTGNASD